MSNQTWTPAFGSRWRHGGWYVANIRWPNGGCGCVSNNYTDKRWRIACDLRPFEEQPSFKTRTEAAIAEHEFVAELHLEIDASRAVRL